MKEERQPDYITQNDEETDTTLATYARKIARSAPLNKLPSKYYSCDPLLLRSFGLLTPLTIASTILLPLLDFLENGILPSYIHADNILQHTLNPKSLSSIASVTIPHTQHVLAVFNAEGDSSDFIVSDVRERVTDQCEDKLFP